MRNDYVVEFGKERGIAGQIPTIEQPDAEFHIVGMKVAALGQSPRGGADPQAQIPKGAGNGGNRRAAALFRFPIAAQEKQIDIGMRKEQTPSIAAERRQSEAGRMVELPRNVGAEEAEENRVDPGGALGGRRHEAGKPPPPPGFGRGDADDLGVVVYDGSPGGRRYRVAADAREDGAAARSVRLLARAERLADEMGLYESDLDRLGMLASDSWRACRLVGDTRPELGGSEFYEMLGSVGLSVPEVRPEEFLAYYRVLEEGGQAELLASAHGLYRGGLGVHLALVSLAAGLGVEVDLSPVAPESPAYASLYSESAGRFLVSVDPAHRERLEELFGGQPLMLIGQVRSDQTVKISRHGQPLLEATLETLKAAWERRFGSLI